MNGPQGQLILDSIGYSARVRGPPLLCDRLAVHSLLDGSQKTSSSDAEEIGEYEDANSLGSSKERSVANI